MKKQMTKEEQISAITSTVREMNVEIAVHGPPVHAYQEILAFKRITFLRRFGRLLKVKYYGKLPKPDLIQAIVDMMHEPQALRLFLDKLEKTGWEFFLNAVAQEELAVDYLFLDFYISAQDMGILQSFYHEDQLFFVVPDEIKQTFKLLESTGYVEEKDFRDDVIDFAIAAINLYGVISQYDFVSLFNSHHERQIHIDDMFDILVWEIQEEIGFCFWNDLIVDDEFEEDDFETVEDLLKERERKTRYAPPYDEFIKYADWDYYEFTPQLEALQLNLMEWTDDLDEIMDLLDQIHDYCSAEANPQEYFDLLTSAGIIFDGIEQMEKTMQLIIDVQNNTRLWRNYGYTPNELAKTTGRAKIIPFPTDRSSQQ